MLIRLHSPSSKVSKTTTPPIGRLAEFNLNRVAVARGGEHNQARYDEGTWDSYFQAPDFDWNIIKQTERQCMLVFCDLFSTGYAHSAHLPSSIYLVVSAVTMLVLSKRPTSSPLEKYEK